MQWRAIGALTRAARAACDQVGSHAAVRQNQPGGRVLGWNHAVREVRGDHHRAGTAHKLRRTPDLSHGKPADFGGGRRLELVFPALSTMMRQIGTQVGSIC